MRDGEKDIRRVLQIGDSKGVTFLNGLEETEFPTEPGALLKTEYQHEDGEPTLKIVPYDATSVSDTSV